MAAQMQAQVGGGGGWRDSLFRVVRGTSANIKVAVYGFKHDAATFEHLLKLMCDVQKLVRGWTGRCMGRVGVGSPGR